MDVTNGEGLRNRKKLRSDEDEKWECSVCTYINPKEAYKCEICFMRKGTSTRKPRPNPQVLEQQHLIAQAILKEKDEEHRRKKSERHTEKGATREAIKLRNFDRSSPLMFEIFANGYSVVITEFPPKAKKKLIHLPESPAASNGSSLCGFSGTTSVNPEQLSPADSNSTTDTNGRCFPFVESEPGDVCESKSKFCISNLAKSVESHLTAVHAVVGGIDYGAKPTHSSFPTSDSPLAREDTGSRVTTNDVPITDDVQEENRKPPIPVGVNRVPSRIPRKVPSRLPKSNLRAKRLPLSEDMKIFITSSRRKRRASENPNYRSTKPIKRRKTRSVHNISRERNHNSIRRSSRQISHRLSTDTECDPLNSDFIGNQTSRFTPIDTKLVRMSKRHSSTPLNLKCKIHLNHQTKPEIVRESSTVTPSHDHAGRPSGNASLDQSIIPELGETSFTAHSRLSSESKNTSAMTDSAGATALEMST